MLNAPNIGGNFLTNNNCWKVDLEEFVGILDAVKTLKSDSVKLKKPIMYTSDYWINMKDLVPIQYILVKQLLVGNDIHEYYRKYTISDYEFNIIKDDWYFTLSRVPKYVTLKRYVIK
ncbi:MAG: hypothetical protein H7068_07940 [Pedobacter sp.]|nr:hypothetical protein [Chitinophagaceae bacterium]